MPKTIAAAAVRGAHGIVEAARAELAAAIERHGDGMAAAYPNTAYYLPIMLMFLGQKVEKLGDLQESLAEAEKLLRPVQPPEQWDSFLPDMLDAGVATLLAVETIEVLKIVNGTAGTGSGSIWLGFTDDAILRTQGIKLVDGRMPGFAAIVGSTPTNEEAVSLVRGLQERNILVFMAGATNGRSIAEQLAEEKIEMNWDTFLVPFGKDATAVAHAFNFAARAAMTFGGITPGDAAAAKAMLAYNRERVPAFVMALGADDGAPGHQLLADAKYAAAAGAVNFGFPIISDTGIPEIPAIPESGLCPYEHVVANVPVDRIVSRAIEVRGLTIKIDKIPIPVPYGAGFEGERVRKEDMYVQFGGKFTDAFELLRMKELEEVEDGKIEVIGPDIEDMDEGGAYPLAIVMEVAGRDFQEDFESVLERRTHEYISCANGIFHMGQRAIIWLRFHRDAVARGFRVKHIGEILTAKIHNDFDKIVDRVQIKLYTDADKVAGLLAEARTAYNHRDDKIGSMTDEDVEEFYSCTLCQSYAPNHVCIVTPQRLGLCGAYTWLDCKAAHQIDEHGPNAPVKKGEVIDPVKGQWQNINEFVAGKSNGQITRFNAYSMLEDPMTSCGCFECIAAIVPEANGILIVDRDHQGMTPIGMKFSTLAGQVGGGNQVPGFIGIGKLYVSSPKFISAEGGQQRIVWMPAMLKEELRERLQARLEADGIGDMFDKIATENEATEIEPLLEYLGQVGHPALTMDPMF